MTLLLKLDNNTYINPAQIVEITVVNLEKLRRERGQNHQTSEQQARLDGKVWEVSVYLKSNGGGYNPQRYTERFKTESDANMWIIQKFGSAIVNSLPAP